MITVGSGVTLYLRNITLTGIAANNAPLILVAGGELVLEDGAVVEKNTNTTAGYDFDTAGGILVNNNVNNNGTLRMEGGKISGNTSFTGRGAGVYVNKGTLRMKTGEISGNTAADNSNGGGGGVYVATTGVLLMEGGEISGNTAGGGGGVFNWGTFTMKGGEISRNIASGSSFGYGGGVYTVFTTFTMEDGKISGNTAISGAGGVYNGAGTFIMKTGEISGNTASSGGGVYIAAGGTFTMKAGKISGNAASSGAGGGVYISGGPFTMEAGEISGNTATGSNGGGGGVFLINTGAIFIKKGGTIYGDTDTTHTPGSPENTAKYDHRGHAVYLEGDKKRNATAGETINLYAKKETGSWTYDDLGVLGDTAANWENP
jgi:hypothetical protein